LVTSHSPDLLDREDLDSESVLAVVADAGVTTVGPLDDVGRDALRTHLFTAGEMLRMNQLEPSPEARATSRSGRLKLFET
jgi:hypothetical protein